MDIEQVNATLMRGSQAADVTAFIWTGVFPDGKRRGAVASKACCPLSPGDALLLTKDGRTYRVVVEPSETALSQIVVGAAASLCRDG